MSEAATGLAISAISGVATKVASVYYDSNKLAIDKKISQTIFRKKWDCNIYFTKFFKFTKQYKLEKINEIIVDAIQQYKTDENRDCTYNVNGVLCNVLPEYGFSGFSEIDEPPNESFDMYPPEEPDYLMIPQVESVTIHISPLSTDKISYMTYQYIISLIEQAILENFNYKRTGSFIYFKFNEKKNLDKMESYLMKKFQKLDQKIDIDKNQYLELKIINKPILEKVIATLI